jgi:hypothetical protein
VELGAAVLRGTSFRQAFTVGCALESTLPCKSVGMYVHAREGILRLSRARGRVSYVPEDSQQRSLNEVQ